MYSYIETKKQHNQRGDIQKLSLVILLQAEVDGQGSAWRASVVASFNCLLVYLTTLC
jgi:hypothetical protein